MEKPTLAVAQNAVAAVVAVNRKTEATVKFRARVDVVARQNSNETVAGLLRHARDL
jgi:hypothetical protein